MPDKVNEMKIQFKSLLYTLLIMFSSLTMAATEKPADQAAPCTEGLTQHHAGPPGKGVDHFERVNCNRAEIAAFERSTSDRSKDASRSGMTVKPGYTRLPKH